MGTIDREEYYPFGDSSLRTFTKKRYRYCGKEKDEESGLYYYGARYYMAWVGRFVSVDPLAHNYAQLSPYNYASNNPIREIDVDGKQNLSQERSQQGYNSEAPDASHVDTEAMKISTNLHGEQAKLFAGLSGGKLLKSEEANRFGQYSYMVDVAGTKYGKPGRLSDVYFFSPGQDYGSYFKEVESSNNGGYASAASVMTFSAETANPYVIAAGAVLSLGIAAYSYLNPPTTTVLDLPIYQQPMAIDRDLPQTIALDETEAFPIPDDFSNVFFHYTDRESILGIASSLTIRADSKNRVFITQSLLTPQEVFSLLFLGQKNYENKGNFMIAFKLESYQMANVSFDKENIMEMIHRGNLKLTPNQVLYVGPNPLK